MDVKKDEKILVSACLAGVNCKYDGTNNINKTVCSLIDKGYVILVCPEQLGGLNTPRSAAEIHNGKVVTKEGLDVTRKYVKGSHEVLKIAKLYNVKKAILKSRSPSCGRNQIYDGTFSHRLKNGSGLTAKLLMDNSVEVISSDDI